MGWVGLPVSSLGPTVLLPVVCALVCKMGLLWGLYPTVNVRFKAHTEYPKRWSLPPLLLPLAPLPSPSPPPSLSLPSLPPPHPHLPPFLLSPPLIGGPGSQTQGLQHAKKPSMQLYPSLSLILPWVLPSCHYQDYSWTWLGPLSRWDCRCVATRPGFPSLL